MAGVMNFSLAGWHRNGPENLFWLCRTRHEPIEVVPELRKRVKKCEVSPYQGLFRGTAGQGVFVY
jgi:hypothetical protein